MANKRVTLSIGPKEHQLLATVAELRDVSLGELMRAASVKAARRYMKSDEGKAAARKRADEIAAWADDDEE